MYSFNNFLFKTVLYSFHLVFTLQNAIPTLRLISPVTLFLDTSLRAANLGLLNGSSAARSNFLFPDLRAFFHFLTHPCTLETYTRGDIDVAVVYFEKLQSGIQAHFMPSIVSVKNALFSCGF
jgi:hypothetical protein